MVVRANLGIRRGLAAIQFISWPVTWSSPIRNFAPSTISTLLYQKGFPWPRWIWAKVLTVAEHIKACRRRYQNTVWPGFGPNQKMSFSFAISCKYEQSIRWTMDGKEEMVTLENWAYLTPPFLYRSGLSASIISRIRCWTIFGYFVSHTGRVDMSWSQLLWTNRHDLQTEFLTMQIRNLECVSKIDRI